MKTKSQRRKREKKIRRTTVNVDGHAILSFHNELASSSTLKKRMKNRDVERQRDYTYTSLFSNGGISIHSYI